MRFVLVGMGVLVAMLSGCNGDDKEYASYGDSVITMDARWDREVDIALVEVHRVMANWVETAEGGKSDPTYKAKSRNVEDNRGTGCGVSRLEFTTENGHVNTLQTITIPGEDLVVILCESDDDTARMNLRRQMMAVLDARGFRLHQ